jgi:predicted nucleic acid-binding protein
MANRPGWLLDTNVISELGKQRPNRSVVAFVAEQELASLYVSCVSMAELRFGIANSLDAIAAQNISAWLESTIRPMFADRVLDIDEQVMLRWVTIVDEGRRSNHTYSQPDLIIAAQALERDLVLVTRNTRDFERAGVLIHNPWSG